MWDGPLDGLTSSFPRVKDKNQRTWNKDFTCPLPAMDPAWGKAKTTELTIPMSVAGLILFEEQAQRVIPARGLWEEQPREVVAELRLW